MYQKRGVSEDMLGFSDDDMFVNKSNQVDVKLQSKNIRISLYQLLPIITGIV